MKIKEVNIVTNGFDAEEKHFSNDIDANGLVESRNIIVFERGENDISIDPVNMQNEDYETTPITIIKSEIAIPTVDLDNNNNEFAAHIANDQFDNGDVLFNRFFQIKIIILILID